MFLSTLIAKIKSDEQTTVAWFAKMYAKLYKSEPSIIAIADRVLPWAGLLLQSVVTVEAGAPAGALVGAGVAEAQKDLDVAGAVIYDAGPTPEAVSLIGSVQANLTGLLTAGHISNAGSVATTTKVITELGNLVAAIPTPAGPAQATA
ncbi:MAG: hypothetical protein ACLQLH_03555 [Terracidiphilus sp.]